MSARAPQDTIVTSGLCGDVSTGGHPAPARRGARRLSPHPTTATRLRVPDIRGVGWPTRASGRAVLDEAHGRPPASDGHAERSLSAASPRALRPLAAAAPTDGRPPHRALRLPRGWGRPGACRHQRPVHGDDGARARARRGPRAPVERRDRRAPPRARGRPRRRRELRRPRARALGGRAARSSSSPTGRCATSSTSVPSRSGAAVTRTTRRSSPGSSPV